ncbi:MAG: hypothetical protein MUF00_18970 [Gemmatimonadaceae bacterium]|jgi:Tfp pilus assembly protein PilV|nr:hypothetical protein [Gemmatimonadaceae bacterium]
MSHRPRSRAGISLIEVLVATVLLGGGVLCIVDATLRLERWHHEALARRAALMGVADRAGERTRTGCGALADGSARGRGHRATWSIAGDSLRAAAREMVQLDARGTRLDARQVVPCER